MGREVKMLHGRGGTDAGGERLCAMGEAALAHKANSLVYQRPRGTQS
jgi:hypothetical protein